MPSILLAHARGEESLAEQVAEPLTAAGYEVVYDGTVLVGESLVEEVSKALGVGSPVVLCGTVKALGTGWAHKVVNAARAYSGIRVFALQMEEDAYLQQLSLDVAVGAYWQDPTRAVSELIEALQKYYPLSAAAPAPASPDDRLERRYRELALRSYDIVDLANLPVTDRNLAARELLLRSLYVALRLSVDTDDSLQEVRDSSAATPFGEPAEQNRRWSVGERLAAAKRLVVLGDPGAGKSTLLRWMATAYLLRLSADPDWPELPDVSELPNEEWLPVLIRCRDLENPAAAGSLERVLAHHLGKLGISNAETTPLTEFLLEQLSSGRALLLIDGLDEISHAGTRAKFCRQIEQFYIAYPKTPMVVTSRIVGYREMKLRIGRGFEHTTVLDLTLEDKDDFARRWCSVTEPTTRREAAEKELIRDIHSTDRIERLTGNPMLLTTMALVKKKVGKLPSKRGDLYREAVNVLLNWRSDVDDLLDPYEALPQLQYIAYAMCAAGVQQLREEEITLLLSKMRREIPSVRAIRNHDPVEFLRLLERRTGILIEIGKVRHTGQLVPAYEFRHLTFQEYLAGLALAQGRFPGRDRKRSLAENMSPLVIQKPSSKRPSRSYRTQETESASENWREALRLCVMSLPDDDVDAALLAISDVPPHEDASITARPRAILALSCLADEPNVSEDVAVTLIDRFSQVVRKGDGDPGGGSAASEALAEVGTSLWAAPIAKQLALAWIEKPSEDLELGASIGCVLNQGIPDTKEGTAKWLLQQKSNLASKAIAERICAALSVMVYAFTVRHSGGQNHTTRSGAVRTELLHLLKHPGREADAAAWAIGWLAGGNVTGDPLWKLTKIQAAKIVSAFTRNHESSPGTRFLLWAIPDDTIPNQELAVALTLYLQKTTENDVVDSIIREYVRLFPHYREPVIALLKAAAESARTAAARILKEIGDAGAIEPLIAALSTPDGHVNSAVADALGELGDHRAVEPLIAALSTPDGHVLSGVADALGKLGSDHATEPLRLMLANPAASDRSTALWALAKQEERHLDRIILSADLDARAPGIDPSQEITIEKANFIASRANADLDDVLRRYEHLQVRYSLKLGWKPEPDNR